MSRIFKLFGAKGSATVKKPNPGARESTLDEAITRATDDAGKKDTWYRIDAIMVRKSNPITDYHVDLSETDPP